MLHAADDIPKDRHEKAEAEIVLNGRGYPQHFEIADPLGDGFCGLYSAGIVPNAELRALYNGGLEPNELIEIAQNFGRPITIWVDPEYQEQLYDPQYINDVPGQQMTHIYWGPSRIMRAPHYQLLIDPTAPNAASERARGVHLQRVKDRAGSNKPMGTKIMEDSHEAWVCGLPPQAASDRLPPEPAHIDKDDLVAKGAPALNAHPSEPANSAKTKEKKEAVAEDDDHVLDRAPQPTSVERASLL